MDTYFVNDDQIGKIKWSVDGRCAYPSSLEKLGGDIIVATYGDYAPFFFEKTQYINYENWKEYLTTYYYKKEDRPIGPGSEGFRLFRPDNGISKTKESYAFSNTGVGSVPESYGWNRTPEVEWMLKETSADTFVNTPMTLNIKQGTYFDLRYLPVLTVSYNWDATGDVINPVADKLILNLIWVAIFGENNHLSGSEYSAVILPWQNAELQDSAGRPLGTFEDIDTSSPANKYKLVLECSINGYDFEFTIEINVTMF